MAKKKSVSKTPRKAAKKSPAKKAKKAPAKTAKKTPVKRAPKKTVLLSTQKEKALSPWPVILIIIGIAVIIVGAWVLFGMGTGPEDVVVPEGEIAASVNGAIILSVTVDKQHAMLPEQYKAAYTRETVLEQLISEELIMQYGREQGFEVSQEEVQAEIQAIVSTDGMTLKDLEENLASFNMSFEEFEDLIARKILIERSMAELMDQSEPVNAAAVRAYYDENRDSYDLPAQVTVRHILIASQRENAAVFSKDLMDQVKDGADFCQLVVEETDDKGSVDKCGEYTFPRGMMVPEFEEASFSMSPGELTIVQSQFGYHIIEKLADVPAAQQAFEDVEESIRTALDQEADSAYYAMWMEGQRTNGDIEVFI